MLEKWKNNLPSVIYQLLRKNIMTDLQGIIKISLEVKSVAELCNTSAKLSLQNKKSIKRTESTYIAHSDIHPGRLLIPCVTPIPKIFVHSNAQSIVLPKQVQLKFEVLEELKYSAADNQHFIRVKGIVVENKNCYVKVWLNYDEVKRIFKCNNSGIVFK